MSADMYNRLTSEQINNFVKFVHDEVKKANVVSLEYLIGLHFNEDSDIRSRQRFLEEVIKTGEFKSTQKISGGIDDFDIKIDHEYPLRISTIEANLSSKRLNDETLPNVFTGQDKMSKISIGLAAISVAFIIISTVLQCKDKTEQEIQGLKSELMNLNNTLKSLKADSVIFVTPNILHTIPQTSKKIDSPLIEKNLYSKPSH